MVTERVEMSSSLNDSVERERNESLYSTTSYQEGEITNNDGVDNPSYVESQEKISRDMAFMVMCSPPASLANSVSVSKTQELQHASSLSTDSTTSEIRVDIADTDGEESLNLTTTHLKRCKRQVLRPYWRLLMFIGWRGFGREYIHNSSCRWQCLNTVYPIFITLLLFYTYIYEIVACQWKLNLQKDTQVIPTLPPTTVPTTYLVTTDSYNIYTILPAMTVITARNLSQAQSELPEACEHVITTYVVPNILHFVAFFLGIYHFRVQENEQMYALMEKVFLQATPLYSRNASQQKMTRNMRMFLFAGAVWILLTLAMQGMYEWAFNFPKLAFFVTTGPIVHWVCFGIELCGIMLLNSILVAVVTNYFTQCEMILFYVKGLALRLQEKSTDLKTAMKDILVVRQNLSLLNGPIAKMTAFVCVIFAELIIIGISILVLNKNDTPKVWAYRSLFPFVWFIILAVPLTQAARVNSVCNRIKKIGLELRVFGYKGSSILELDSFLSYVESARLRAKLFHIPILPSYLISTIVLALFIILILLQTSVIGSDNFF